MLWGGPRYVARTASVVVGNTGRGQSVQGVAHGVAAIDNPSLAFLIHTRTIAAELRTLEER